MRRSSVGRKRGLNVSRGPAVVTARRLLAKVVNDRQEPPTFPRSQPSHLVVQRCNRLGPQRHLLVERARPIEIEARRHLVSVHAAPAVARHVLDPEFGLHKREVAFEFSYRCQGQMLVPVFRSRAPAVIEAASRSALSPHNH